MNNTQKYNRIRNDIINEAEKYIKDANSIGLTNITYKCNPYYLEEYIDTLYNHLNKDHKFKYLVRLAYFGYNRQNVCIKWCCNKDYVLFIDNVDKVMKDISKIKKIKYYPFITKENILHFCYYLNKYSVFNFKSLPECRYVGDVYPDYIIYTGHISKMDTPCKCNIM